MNGKKAKLLRALTACHPKDGRSYVSIPTTRREQEIPHPAGLVGLDGKPIIIGKIVTFTKTLKDSPRKLYKVLKKDYKARRVMV